MADYPDIGQKWVYDTGRRFQYSAPSGSDSVVIVGGLDNYVYSVASSTGSESWSFERHGSLSDSSPLVGDEFVFIGGGGGTLYALYPDADSPTRVAYQIETDSAVTSTPVLKEGTVYFGTNDGAVRAINEEFGTDVWGGPSHVNAPVYSNLAAGGEYLYLTLLDGRVLALDLADGSHEWAVETQATFRKGSPAVYDDTVYVAADELYALDYHTGDVKESNPYGGMTDTTPLIYDGMLYIVGADESLSAFDLVTDELAWTLSLDSPISTNPVLFTSAHTDFIIVGVSPHDLVFIDIESREVASTVALSTEVQAPPAIDDNDLYVGSEDGKLTAYDIDMGVSEPELTAASINPSERSLIHGHPENYTEYIGAEADNVLQLSDYPRQTLTIKFDIPQLSGEKETLYIDILDIVDRGLYADELEIDSEGEFADSITKTNIDNDAGEIEIEFDGAEVGGEGLTQDFIFTWGVESDAPISYSGVGNYRLELNESTEQANYRLVGRGATGIHPADAKIELGDDAETIQPTLDGSEGVFKVREEQSITLQFENVGDTTGVFEYLEDDGGVARGSFVTEIGTAPGAINNLIPAEDLDGPDIYLLDFPSPSEGYVVLDVTPLHLEATWKDDEVNVDENLYLGVSADDVTGTEVTLSVYNDGEFGTGDEIHTDSQPLDGSGNTTFVIDPIGELDGEGEYFALVEHTESQVTAASGLASVNGESESPDGSTIVNFTISEDETTIVDRNPNNFTEYEGAGAENVQQMVDSPNQTLSLTIEPPSGEGSSQSEMLRVNFSESAAAGLEVNKLKIDSDGDLADSIESTEIRNADGEILIEFDTTGISGEELQQDITVTWVPESIIFTTPESIDRMRHTIELNHASQSAFYNLINVGATGIHPNDAKVSIGDDTETSPTFGGSDGRFFLWEEQLVAFQGQENNTTIDIFELEQSDDGEIVRGDYVFAFGTAPGAICTFEPSSLEDPGYYIVDYNRPSEEIIVLETHPLDLEAEFKQSEITVDDELELEVTANDRSGADISIEFLDDSDEIVLSVSDTLDGDGSSLITVVPNEDLDGIGSYRAAVTYDRSWVTDETESITVTN